MVSIIMDIKIATYNVRSALSNGYAIQELLNCNDIIALQETWLHDQNVNFLNSLSSEFSFYACSPLDVEESILIGRPYGVLALLFKNNVRNCVKLIPTNDTRILCIDVSLPNTALRIINCYLPYNDGTNIAEYVHYLAKIHCLMHEHTNGCCLILGDFNADPSSNFGNELSKFCQEYGYVLADLLQLSGDSFTYVSNATGHT